MYVIPLVILIVVLIIVKKRQDAQGTDQPTKKSAAKTKGKQRKAKVSNTKTVARPTQEVEDTIAAPTAEQPISNDLRNNIEGLIKDRNFFAAEAKINQALKQNNAQHELYLLLLDIHISQKDDFAIDQLLSHIRSLELDKILEQAEVKLNNDTSKSSDELISFTPDSSFNQKPEPTPAPIAKVNQDAAFESLFATDIHAKVEPTEEFSAPPLEQPKAVFEPENSANKEIETLEFDVSNISQAASEVSEPASLPLEEIQPLDFTFSLSTQESTQQEATIVSENIESVAETHDFTLDFSVAEAEVSSEKPQETITATQVETTPTNFVRELEFSLDFPEEPIKETTQELNLEFEAPAIEVEAPTTLTNVADIEFRPSSSKSNELSFAEETPLISSAPTHSIQDPLLQSFPDLSKINEIELNLDLAKTYIQLGAYDAAREILLEGDADYTSTQREVAEQLLNQIAS